MVWLIILLIAVLWGWAIYNQFHSVGKRTREMQLVAGQLGLQYSDIDDEWTKFEWGDPVPTKGGAINILTGQHQGWSVIALDRSWGAAYGRGRGSEAYSVSAVALSREFPRLYVHQRSLVSRARGVKEGNRIELESAQFNTHYVVHCKDPQFASAVLTPRTMQWLLEHNVPWFNIVDRLVATGRKGMLAGDQIESDLAAVETIAGQLPRFLFD
ncbi:MAG: DUF3137 domain-containing protein [Antricoccus sp.]